MKEKAEPVQKLYTRMRLWEFPDEYVIEPTDGSSASSSLSISLVDASMKLIDSIPECSSFRVPKIQMIFGVVGMLKLVAGSYLFVITERKCVGSYLGHPIFKVISLKVLPCVHSIKNSTPEQKKVENEFSRPLKVSERTTGLYFSYDTNLTLSTQRLYDLGNESKMLPLWRQLDPYLLPVVQGRTRMWRRGADPEGHVANFVETEQIIQINGFTSSFVQVRGSIPFLWEQIVDLTYKPKFEIVRPEEAVSVFTYCHYLNVHLNSFLPLPTSQYMTYYAATDSREAFSGSEKNHGGEGCLSDMFSNAMQPIVSEDLRYLHFDFTKICGHVHFERLSFLYDKIADFPVKNGYFLLNEESEKMQQLGVVRTNCIDCLDRTDITQSMIATKNLELQLRRIGVFAAEETISSHPKLDRCFRILWANHGDDISIQYSGTAALKGDLVRSGQRRVQGILKDRYISLKRYYLNNFSDGTKQDAIDLLQGHYKVSLGEDITPPSQTGGLEAIASFPLALCLVLIGLLLTTMSLGQVGNDPRHLLYSVVWGSISVGIASFVRAKGRIFCNRPRLQLHDKPGY
ncbi:hypothetical protein CXB51_026574 [Gossypium anomalum]|uniref:SAC domain-containing protein n=1 Tax=Gossypium anomalum TaxID=47600 RepID=A0A8J5YMG3_9ROSI|nr:hypothetical protein CXB51_026574 [Gossypium anomalum]